VKRFIIFECSRHLVSSAPLTVWLYAGEPCNYRNSMSNIPSMSKNFPKFWLLQGSLNDCFHWLAVTWLNLERLKTKARQDTVRIVFNTPLFPIAQMLQSISKKNIIDDSYSDFTSPEKLRVGRQHLAKVPSPSLLNVLRIRFYCPQRNYLTSIPKKISSANSFPQQNPFILLTRVVFALGTPYG